MSGLRATPVVGGSDSSDGSEGFSGSDGMHPVMDEVAWARGLGAGSLGVTVLALLALVLGPAVGFETPGAGGPLSVLSSFSPLEAMVFLFGPPLVLSLAGLAFYLRLDGDERAEAALLAPVVIVGVPVPFLMLWMIAMASMGPV